MTCEHCEALLDQYLKGVMDAGEKAELTAHLEGCPACRLRLQVLEDCQGINEMDEVPVGFSASWRQAIREEEVIPMKRHWTRWLATAAALVVLIAGTWLTGNELRRLPGRQPMVEAAYGGGPYEAAPEADFASVSFDMEMPRSAAPVTRSMMEAAPAAEEKGAGQQQAKIIRTISFTSSTRNFDQDYQKIRQDLESAGGRIENADVRTGSGGLRSAYLTLRIPADKLDGFAEMLKGMGHLQSFSESAEDVSERYADTAGRLKTQKEKMERLTALLAKAVSVEDLVALESAIADTQYLIDSYTGQLQGMDSRVNDATLRLTLNEMSALDTAETREENLWERIASGVSHMWKLLKEWAADAAVFLVAAVPVLILIAIVAVLVKIVVKRRKNK